MKYVIPSLIFFLSISSSTKAQEYLSNPGLEKFMGTWQYINGQDTITFKNGIQYLGGSSKVKCVVINYRYKRGTIVIADNLSGTSGNFIGAKPFGISLDSLVIGGEDKIKRKMDEGYLIATNNNSQIKFKRRIGINGGGMDIYPAGQEPLAGYALPDGIILTKMAIEYVE